MSLADMIARRRSVRAYVNMPLDAATKEDILSYLDTVRPLFPSIDFRAEFIPREKARCTIPMPWLPQDALAFYAEDSIPSRMNAGFLLATLDLRLQEAGLGACWLGVGRPVDGGSCDGLPFLTMMAVGYPDAVPTRTSATDFNRKPPSEIADEADARLEPARLAPSAMNAQPWYFTHERDHYHLYCATRRSRALRGLAHLDMGIALAHLAAANPQSFACFGARILRTVPGHEYIASFRI